MATSRTPIGRPPTAQITPEAVALFKRLLEFEETGDDRAWEADGGRREQYHAAHFALHEMLGLAPWDVSVLDAFGEPSKEDFDHGWHRVVALREALEAEEAAK